ncbi:protein LNK3-like [Vicia villosa]|uniref:protein LNK3-like n=1 Tax=Vicia villosa TaxID=3911 RepID=UPI00273B1623|nr:protein LNK3-like [Vicia villosa]
MDWYYGCGTNDFVVPGDQDLLATHPSPENWSKWGINAPEGYNSPKNFMSMDSSTTEAEFNFDGESFSNRVKFESSSYDKAQSSSSSVCEGLTDQSFQQTSLSRNHHRRQTNYQLQELSSSFEQTDDIFLDSILEDFPCAENLNKSFYFYPENQCSNSPGGLQRDMAASEFLSCNSNSDDCLNIETLQILDHSEQFNGDEAMHNHSSIEESTLQNLEAIISQFNDKTRISFRDALYRLARDTKQQHPADDLDGDISMQEALRSDDQQPMESETNSVDRAVANLMFNGTAYTEC